MHTKHFFNFFQFQYVKRLNKELNDFDHSSYQRIVAPMLLLKKSCRPGKPQGYANSYKPGLFAILLFKRPPLVTYRSLKQKASDKLIPTTIRSAENTDNTFMVWKKKIQVSITMSSFQNFTVRQSMLGTHAIWVQHLYNCMLIF